MPKLKAGTIIPSVAQDRTITAASRLDPDAKPFTDAQWKAAAPTVRIGGPPKAAPKEAVKLRLDSDVLAVLRATGAGWQTRVNQILSERLALPAAPERPI